MRLLVQRVQYADVTVNTKTIGAINHGFLVFVGISDSDTKETVDKMLTKLLNLRIFEDENGKTNLSIRQVSGEILLISFISVYDQTMS